MWNRIRLVLSNVLYDSLNENEYGFVIGLSTSASATLKLGLKADNRSMYATKGLFCVESIISLGIELSKVLK